MSPIRGLSGDYHYQNSGAENLGSCAELDREQVKAQNR
jgi:hypothetical protein